MNGQLAQPIVLFLNFYDCLVILEILDYLYGRRIRFSKKTKMIDLWIK